MREGLGRLTVSGSGREQSFWGELENCASKELEAFRLPGNAASGFATRVCEKKNKGSC